MKTFLIILIEMGMVTLGDLALSRGMRQLGPAPLSELSALLVYAGRVLTSPYIIGGIGFLMVSFFLWLVVLSRVDLSFALPLTAVGYIFNAFAARMVLHEQISLTRWIGTVVICLGMIIIARAS